MSDPAGYTVGWICALAVEYIAAQEFLDEEHDKPSFVSPNDANDYTLGKIGEHNVVIAVLPDGEYGIASAASAATNMLNTFHNIRIGLMVGIGGGVPSESHDIRLGDVVVSAPRSGESGVLQYDFGKTIQSQDFQHTRFLNQPPRILRTAMTGIIAQYERKGHRLKEAIDSILEKNTRLNRKFKRPEPIADRLFHPEVIHNLGGCAICANDPSKLVSRNKRHDYEDDPAIHYGLIASGNRLMKDALIRDKLAAEKDVLCFEMEAAGLMNNFPCLVIRGICDYSDSHKNKKWQGFAAMVAAAYAKDLLQRIPLSRIETEERISAIISEDLKGIKQHLNQSHSQQELYFSEQQARVFTDQQQRCYQVFKVANYIEQKNINPKRVEGTCQWALQSPEYTRWWESNRNDLLWVSADPGCGKSVLARCIVDDYLETSYPSVRICYFFFKDNDEQNSLSTAICSVLHQLFSQQSHLLQIAIPSWERNGETLRQEVDELWRIFLVATSTDTSCKTICIFDALDECREVDRDRLIEKLQLFYHQSCSSTRETCLKFLLTSRPYDHIQNQFGVITNPFPHLHLKGEEENDQIHKEINLVVKMRVKKLAKTAKLSLDIQQRLEQQLLQMNHRTYLWLHLAMNDIRSRFEDSFRPSEESIQMIPLSVNEAYQKILSRVPVRQLDSVRKALQIIVAARRPLTTAEMAIALGVAICPESRTISEARLHSSQIERKLRRLCGLFVFINNSKIYLIHQTAREFLIAGKVSNSLDSVCSWNLVDAEEQIGSICLRYLLMEDLEKDEGKPSLHNQDFLEYSAVHWPDHIREMNLKSGSPTVNQLNRLYDIGAKPFSLWFPIFWKVFRPYGRTPMLDALHIAAFNGHVQGIDYLLEVDEVHINTPDSTSTYPITWASLNGHKVVVQMFLERGADINVFGGQYGNALQAACSKGHTQIVQMLLDKGADVNAQGGRYGNALQAACSGGYYEIVKMLLVKGADVDKQGGQHGNALQAACSEGHDRIVRILINKGADVNIQGGDYGNSLHTACFEGFDKIVQLLLEKEPDMNIQVGEYGNALQAACSSGHNQIVHMLLDKGTDVNAQGHTQIVQMLLDKGADVNAQGRFSQSLYGIKHIYALHAACSGGHDDIVKMLLDKGASVNAQGGEYGTALQVACSRGYTQIVQMLLDKGANINAQGGEYETALQAACYEGHDNIAQMLLNTGADINAQGGEYGNALQAACSGGYTRIVQMLLDKGTDVKAQGGEYGTALQAACSRGHTQIVQMLLDNGADVNIQGGRYETALQAASSKGHYNIEQLLLDKGAHVNAQGGNCRKRPRLLVLEDTA
ncbi:hypothetical protein N7507_006795 [Penicillium longicatenatum]|nr:hypothetical protein N7507_006795 [Penicillium longicatenatum]